MSYLRAVFSMIATACLLAGPGAGGAVDLSGLDDASQAISFFNPSGVNGFIVYDVQPEKGLKGLTYGRQSYNLNSPFGLPVRLDVESFKMNEQAYDLQQLLDVGDGNFLEMFSIQHALNYGTKSTLSSAYSGSTDITMVVLSANYRATEKFMAKLSTGLSQAVNEKDGATSSDIGYELDIAGLYEIAPGLTFSVGAGYATNLETLTEVNIENEEKRSWLLNSKLRLKF